MKPTLYAACNLDYFVEHGLALAQSAHNNQTKLVLEMFPNIGDNDVNKFINEWILKRPDEIFEHVTLQMADLKLFNDLSKCLDIKETRAFYACYRFLNLPRMLLEHDNLLIIDVDAIINKPVILPDEDYDFGLFLRESENLGGNAYEREGMKVAAGAVYVTRKAQKFVSIIQDHLLNNEIRWFVDQAAIYQAYKKCTDLSFLALPKTVIDWEFNNDSMIFTAKGNRKTSPEYLKIKNRVLSTKQNV